MSSVQIRVLPGLPPYGDLPKAFSDTGYGLHCEGLVVEFTVPGKAPWIGNFVRGLTRFDLAVPHPDSIHALVIAGGQGYVVEPVSQSVVDTCGSAIQGCFQHPDGTTLVLEHQGISFSAVGVEGLRWRSRRVSWDGFRSVHVEGMRLKGEAWLPDDTWHPFELDLQSGEVVGGSYVE